MELTLCDECKGTGEVIEQYSFPNEQWPDWYGEGFVYVDCPKCDGTGLFPSNPIYCNDCGGKLVLV